MEKTPTSIIAFFARGREIGFAVLELGQITRYGVKTIKGKRKGKGFAARVEQTLAPLLESASWGKVVVEKPPVHARTGELCRVMTALAKRWQKQGYPVCRLSLEKVKRTFCGHPQATIRELTEAVAEQYPILWSLAQDSRKPKGKYWEKVLLAVALMDTATSRNG